MTRKSLSLALILLISLSTTLSVDAHPGRTDKNGGHTCKTNCEKWGLEYGEYHYHNKKSSSSTSSTSKTTKSTAKTPQATAPAPKPKPEYESADVSIMIDNKRLSLSQDPILYREQTLVPLRELFEGLGANVDWNATTETALGQKGDTTVSIKVGDSTAYRNGTAITLSQAALNINGKIMVPLRFISESFNATVEWDETSRTILIATPAQ